MRAESSTILAGALALAISAGARPASAATFAKGPYLQWLGPTAVTVKIELSTPAPATLAVFAAGTLQRVASPESLEPRAFHAVHVDGLTPGTTYDYQVSAGGEVSDLGHFTTAPAGDPPFRFILYGDSRTDHPAHAAVVRLIEGAPGDFLINTGDMVAAGKDPADWQVFFDIERKLLRDRCAFVAVGNHELSRGDPAGEVAFLRYFGREAEVDKRGEPRRLHGSFRWSNTRFFLLNAMDNWTGEEREWLRAELDHAMVEPGILHRIAVLHHGPFSSGPHGGNTKLADAGVIALMRERKVDLVLAGHDHVYERGEGQGLKYVISGGSGAPLYEKEHSAPETQRFEAVHHYVEVAVNGPLVQMVARRASGSVIEACSFRGEGPWVCDPPPPAPDKPRRASSCGCDLPGRGQGDAGWIAALLLATASATGRRRDRCA